LEDKSLINRILFLFVLILLNAFFAGSEIALISLNDSKIKMLAEEGNKKAEQLNKLLNEPSRFLATIQIGITLVGFLASAFAAESFADPLVNQLGVFNLPVSESLLKVITVVVITIILSYFTLVLGELVPKRVAMKKAESISFAVVTPLILLSKFTSPFVSLLTISTNFLVRLFGIDPYSVDDDVTEEEIRMMIDIGEERGAIEEHEKIMINNIFEFNNKTAEDIMTHRMEITGVSSTISLEDLIEIFKRDHYSRIPVYEESIDNIIGVLHVKDLIPLIAEDKSRNFSLDSFIRKPFFTSIQKRVDELFVELQESQNHIAVVIDEYGGTAGIVTIEDITEEIFGNIFDEHDKEEDREFKQIDELTFEVRGTISLYELQGYLNIELPVEEYDTLNGFLIGLFGNIPPKDRSSEVKFNDLIIQTVEVSDKRIEKVIILVKK
jgi:putative hemolysin